MLCLRDPISFDLFPKMFCNAWSLDLLFAWIIIPVRGQAKDKKGILNNFGIALAFRGKAQKSVFVRINTYISQHHEKTSRAKDEASTSDVCVHQESWKCLQFTDNSAVFTLNAGLHKFRLDSLNPVVEEEEWQKKTSAQCWNQLSYRAWIFRSPGSLGWAINLVISSTFDVQEK